MGGYIGAKTGTLVASASDIRGDISATDATPEITLKNTTETDADGTRSGKITFKGEQSGGEESVLAQIQGSHDGASDDEKGDLIFKTNDGNDALAPTERLRINSAGDVLVSSPDPSLTITNTTEEDTDGGREGTIVFKGEQSGGELSTLAEIEASHDGTADDEKGDLIFKTNDGSDGVSPTERLRIDSDGSIITATLGTDNVHLGENAGAAIASGGNNNVAIGKDAGTAITTGDGNVAVGYQSLDANTTADNNTAIGISALGANTTGSPNTAVGSSALTNNTTASQNVGVGTNAGLSTTTGGENTFVGWHSGYSNTTSTANTYLGRNAGGATTGAQNTFIGTSSGGLVTSGAKNSILGMYNGNNGGLDIRTSDNNIVLSDGDGNPRYWYNGASNYICLAGASGGNDWQNNAGMVINGQGSQSQYITISNTTTTEANEAFIVHRAAAVSNGEAIQFYRASSPVGSITVGSGSTSYNTSSDYRLKENVSDLTGATERLKQLQPKKFSWIDDKLDAPDTEGFIAHEVKEIVPKAVSGDKDEMKVDHDGKTVPRYQGIDQSKLVPLLTAALQEAMTRIETLEAQNTTQATQIADLITRVTALEAE